MAQTTESLDNGIDNCTGAVDVQLDDVFPSEAARARKIDDEGLIEQIGCDGMIQTADRSVTRLRELLVRCRITFAFYVEQLG
ncbi:unnamed protein product [Chondrus crispus]|uniref:Uncharacterized protein n=1 Tax=Chondrus crispus TaxID=2769 RepID=R7QLG1_CHOCR|nr:unnamed protein product [Chondrus crispus]CDF38603.1 unnamed protein product [Chondrus crispus]|eukprot:XP_005718508.1 unnamed protein product [Chondrus crispus]